MNFRRSLFLVPVSVLSLAAFASLEGCNRTVGVAGPNGEAGSALVGTPCSETAKTVACTGDEVTTCVGTPDGKTVWSPCAVSECDPGETKVCEVSGAQGYQECQLGADQRWHFSDCMSSGGSTPLVLSFDDAPVSFSHADGSFGVDPMRSVDTDWPSAATPWLALDRNGNGRIDDGGELFGSATLLSDGSYAKNGFQALAELDQNHDGVISPADPAFDSLVVWSDLNQNRVTDPGEVRSLRSLGVEAIELDYGRSPRCDARGNCEIETARFVFRAQSGERKVGHVVDVHLAWK